MIFVSLRHFICYWEHFSSYWDLPDDWRWRV